MEAGGPRGGGRKGTTVLLRAIQILAGVEGLVEERNTVLLRAIQNTGGGGLGGERTTVLLHAIQNAFIIYTSQLMRACGCNS